jgi:glycine cleavage system H protein
MTPLFVVATIIFFLGVDWLVRRMKKGQAEVPAAASQAVPPAYPMRIPEGVFFARSHTWLNLFPSGRVRLGVDDLVGSLLDNPEVTFMRSPGERVEKGDPLLSLGSGENHLIVRSPIAGEILAINNELESRPALMREKLFSDGWAYTIRPKGVEELRSMLLGDETRQWMADEFQRLRDLLAGVAANRQLAPATLHDGGAPAPGLLKHLDASGWKKIEAEFLKVE